MSKKIDIKTGDRFGRLVIIKEAEAYLIKSGRSKGRHSRQFECQCDCGRKKTIAITSLRFGQSRSCGCLRDEKIREANTIHGEAKKTSEYTLWCKMKSRCHNKKDLDYYNYGGRGISVYPPWRKQKTGYPLFIQYLLSTIGRRPSLEMSLDRIDGEKGYEPGNLRWATSSEQTRNKRTNQIIKYKNKAKCLADWAIESGVKRETLSWRIKKGWNLDEVFNKKTKE